MPDHKDDETMREQLLNTRAVLLASFENESETFEERGRESLVFGRRDELYALPVDFVERVHPLRELAPLPGAPPYLPGITNVEGYVMPVVDLMTALGASGKGISEHSQIIVVNAGEARFALLADSVRGVEMVEVSTDAEHKMHGFRDFLFVSGLSLEGVLLIDVEKLAKDPGLFGEKASAGQGGVASVKDRSGS